MADKLFKTVREMNLLRVILLFSARRLNEGRREGVEKRERGLACLLIAGDAEPGAASRRRREHP
jgi:hypothetical protein